MYPCTLHVHEKPSTKLYLTLRYKSEDERYLASAPMVSHTKLKKPSVNSFFFFKYFLAGNPSCEPNAEVTFPHNNSTLVLKALHDIKEGEVLQMFFF